jgi:glycosyltransferase involved in cell wall biosynthesis
MPAVPLRELASPRAAAPDRVFYFNTWFRGHNNARYAELLPRLERLDVYLLTFPRPRVLRGAGLRAWGALRPRVEPAILRRANRLYRAAFVTDVPQLAHLTIPAVVDVDDPRFSEEEAALLARPNVAAYVVTAESAARRLEQLGVEKPWHVVPQGVSLQAPAAGDVERVPGRQVVGYTAAWLLARGDRGGDNPLYNVEHLLELWDAIHARVPSAELWLLGGVGSRARRLLAGRDGIRLFGRVPRERLLAHVAGFDVALYPRTEDQGVRASKIAEYLGAGVPTVSYDYAVVDDLRTAGAGLLVRTPREFVDAVVRLLTDSEARRALAAAAAAAGAERDWDLLAARYVRILAEYLPH